MSELPAATESRAGVSNPSVPWWRLLNRYHWFVLIVAALGWLFDCLDQQLFNLARLPAMAALLPPGYNHGEYAGYATAIFLMGWATGGLVFGVLGDRIGRAKTMMLTILMYSLCTGLSAFSQGFYDFAFYRFLTGLGVGGEFAVGVALVAEVMPDRARPYALGLLQALSAVGNVSAALISMGFGHLEESGRVEAWRAMFIVGALPAFLALVIRARLKEPEQWKALKERGVDRSSLGSYAELFGNPNWRPPAVVAGLLIVAIFIVAFAGPKQHKLLIGFVLAVLALCAGLVAVFGGGFKNPSPWRRNAVVGLVLACSGVIGLWGIGFFSIDLTRSVFRKPLEQEQRIQGEAEKDAEFLRLALANPGALLEIPKARELKAGDLISLEAGGGAGLVMNRLLGGKAETSLESLRAELLEENKPVPPDLDRYFPPVPGDPAALLPHVERIKARRDRINGELTFQSAVTSMWLNAGAFLGMITFSLVTQRIGRKPAFAIGFVLAMLSTAMVFWFFRSSADFWMIPVMGFCQLALFGGYAIYFPELFPTHLRSTGTSFCYNVGRFVAASGPAVLGLLTSRVFDEHPEPMRYAGLTMCGIFILGLLALPFAPETKGKPLPQAVPVH